MNLESGSILPPANAPNAKAGWRLAIVLVIAAVLCLAGAAFGFQLLHAKRESTRGALCSNTLRQIGLAIVLYKEQQFHYPPAVIRDKAGQPMHSWRIMLLRGVGDEFADIVQQYNFDEPWNSPHNQKLAAKAPWIYRCPSDTSPPGDTSYVAVVGNETVWPVNVGLPSLALGDTTSETLLVVEASGSGINWLEPRDLPFEVAAKGFAPPGRPGIRSEHPDGVRAVFCDVHVDQLPHDMPAEVIRALLTRSGNEEITKEWVFD